MKPYATWKYVVLVIAVIFGLLYAAPNLYGDDPSVQISLASGEPLPPELDERIAAALGAESLPPLASGLEDGRWVVRFDDPSTQLRAADALKRELGRDYVVALNLASKTPEWLKAIGGRPMNLGLDLRGGVHFLLEVDIDDVRNRALERIVTEVPALLRKEDIRYTGRRSP
jgi:preprotein translocase subunit SecD